MTNSAFTKSRGVSTVLRGAAVSPWILADGIIWAAVFVLALWMRFDFSVARLGESLGTGRFYIILLGLIGISWVTGWVVGLYRGRYVPGSLLEITVLTAVVAGATSLVFLGHILVGPYDGVPRSTPIVAGAFAALSALVARSVVRRKELFGAGVAQNAEPTIVFGAGDGGVQLVRQLRRSKTSHFSPVAILDDDPSKHQMLVDGVRVRGGRDQIAVVAEKTNASTLIIAVPSLPPEDLIKIRDMTEAAGLHVLVLPPLEALMRGRVTVDELREINVNDLLGRNPARLNQTQIANYIRGKRVMVTGAGGSIGSELCRQLSRFRPAELMMLDRDESGLHAVQLSINDQAMLDGDDTILASIRDKEVIAQIFYERRPQIVFHAAALKHMPLLEQYPLEALKTNVIGTQNLLQAAEASGVETFINISTDKAANPCSALGTSKRIAERLTVGQAGNSKTGKFASVRFGNVLGSRGSVLTVFERQIRNGGPVTVTDPEVTRYFMTIPEACQLVLQAAVLADTGTTMVLDMGEPIRISEVATTLIEQSGKNIDIVYTGLRHNEKLSEDLFDESEQPVVGAKHEALSEVRVPPLRLAAEVRDLFDNKHAVEWLNDNTQ